MGGRDVVGDVVPSSHATNTRRAGVKWSSSLLVDKYVRSNPTYRFRHGQKARQHLCVMIRTVWYSDVLHIREMHGEVARVGYARIWLARTVVQSTPSKFVSSIPIRVL